MWITFFDWFLAIFSIGIWVGTYVVWQKEKCKMWFDNKFGKDDPMPPMPKQQNNMLNTGENTTFNYKETQDKNSEQPKK